MKKMKKQEMINTILRMALWYHVCWTEETRLGMKIFYKGYVDGIFQILHEMDMIDDFWKLREDPKVIEDIKTYGYSGWDGRFSFAEVI